MTNALILKDQTGRIILVFIYRTEKRYNYMGLTLNLYLILIPVLFITVHLAGGIIKSWTPITF